jgi:SNF2 family DNA or RNA helicase
MGIGKTVITCYALRHILARRVVILCPNSVKWSWVDHLKDWTDYSNIVIVDSAMTKKKAAEVEDIVIAGKREDRDLQLTKHCRASDVVIVINFDQLRLHADVLSGYEWDVLVVDEAHRIKNPKALQTKAAVKLSRVAANAWLVTGTPARNKLMDLWQLLNICDPLPFLWLLELY